jgi:hypothetical protein
MSDLSGIGLPGILIEYLVFKFSKSRNFSIDSVQTIVIVRDETNKATNLRSFSSICRLIKEKVNNKGKG